MEGEWAVGNFEGIINVSRLWSYIKTHNIQPEDIPYELISHKPLDVDISSARFQLADTSFPLIVVRGMTNPHSKPYRLIDGRHRLVKLLPAIDVSCYVISYKTAILYAEP